MKTCYNKKLEEKIKNGKVNGNVLLHKKIVGRQKAGKLVSSDEWVEGKPTEAESKWKSF